MTLPGSSAAPGFQTAQLMSPPPCSDTSSAHTGRSSRIEAAEAAAVEDVDDEKEVLWWTLEADDMLCRIVVMFYGKGVRTIKLQNINTG